MPSAAPRSSSTSWLSTTARLTAPERKPQRRRSRLEAGSHAGERRPLRSTTCRARGGAGRTRAAPRQPGAARGGRAPFVEERIEQGERVWNGHVDIDCRRRIRMPVLERDRRARFARLLLRPTDDELRRSTTSTASRRERPASSPRRSYSGEAFAPFTARLLRATCGTRTTTRPSSAGSPSASGSTFRPAFALRLHATLAPCARSCATAFHRGVVFLDGHGRRESALLPGRRRVLPGQRRAHVVVLAGRALGRPAAVVVAAALAAAVAVARRRSGQRPWHSALAPVYAVAHGAGMWRGAHSCAVRGAADDPRRLRDDGRADQARAGARSGCDERGHRYLLATTGQQVQQIPSFLEQFGLPQPDLWLARGAGGRDLRSNRDIPGWLAASPRRSRAAPPRCAARFGAAPAQPLVLVHGDTMTTVLGARWAARSAFRSRTSKAGLRSFDLRNPFPEELNRRLASRLASIHYAPGAWAAGNLRAATIVDTGSNTIRDSLALVRGLAEPGRSSRTSRSASSACTASSCSTTARLLDETLRALRRARAERPAALHRPPGHGGRDRASSVSTRFFDDRLRARSRACRFFDFVARSSGERVPRHRQRRQPGGVLLPRSAVPCAPARGRSGGGLGENVVLSRYDDACRARLPRRAGTVPATWPAADFCPVGRHRRGPRRAGFV